MPSAGYLRQRTKCPPYTPPPNGRGVHDGRPLIHLNINGPQHGAPQKMAKKSTQAICLLFKVVEMAG